MVAVRPVAAWVVDPDFASDVVGPAYDALAPAERRALAEASQDSFFNVLRPPATSPNTTAPSRRYGEHSRRLLSQRRRARATAGDRSLPTAGRGAGSTSTASARATTTRRRWWATCRCGPCGTGHPTPRAHALGQGGRAGRPSPPPAHAVEPGRPHLPRASHDRRPGRRGPADAEPAWTLVTVDGVEHRVWERARRAARRPSSTPSPRCPPPTSSTATTAWPPRCAPATTPSWPGWFPTTSCACSPTTGWWPAPWPRPTTRCVAGWRLAGRRRRCPRPSRPARAGIAVVGWQGTWYAVPLEPRPGELDVDAAGRVLLEPLAGVVDARTDPRLDFVPGDDDLARLGALAAERDGPGGGAPPAHRGAAGGRGRCRPHDAAEVDLVRAEAPLGGVRRAATAAGWRSRAGVRPAVSSPTGPDGLGQDRPSAGGPARAAPAAFRRSSRGRGRRRGRRGRGGPRPPGCGSGRRGRRGRPAPPPRPSGVGPPRPGRRSRSGAGHRPAGRHDGGGSWSKGTSQVTSCPPGSSRGWPPGPWPRCVRTQVRHGPTGQVLGGRAVVHDQHPLGPAAGLRQPRPGGIDEGHAGPGRQPAPPAAEGPPRPVPPPPPRPRPAPPARRGRRRRHRVARATSRNGRLSSSSFATITWLRSGNASTLRTGGGVERPLGCGALDAT